MGARVVTTRRGNSAAGVVALVRAAHIGPTLIVTALAALLAVASGLGASRLMLVTAAVFAGQLVVGWSNDFIDAERDAAVHRTDKPLVTGELTRHAVMVAIGVAGVVAVALSGALGWRSALVHLGVVVGSLMGYNLGLKSTPWSWLPYTLAFGALPAVTSLASSAPALPPAWVLAASATLGTAAHFLNTLPDLADDAATGVKGLPHRIGGRRSKIVATILLLSATTITALGPAGGPAAVAWIGLFVAAALAVGVVVGRGRIPFYCGVAIATVNATLLVLVG